MCTNGSCGNFDATGRPRFVIPAHQPIVPGVRLPTAGLFIDERGKPIAAKKERDHDAQKTELTDRLHASPYFFSRRAALAFRPGLKRPGEVGKRTLKRIAEDITACERLGEKDNFAGAELDFARPMLDFAPVRGVRAIAVWKQAQMLRFGKHPMAPLLFSHMQALEAFTWLRVELAITFEDERRLQQALVQGNRFADLPMVKIGRASCRERV